MHIRRAFSFDRKAIEADRSRQSPQRVPPCWHIRTHNSIIRSFFIARYYQSLADTPRTLLPKSSLHISHANTKTQLTHHRHNVVPVGECPVHFVSPGDVDRPLGVITVRFHYPQRRESARVAIAQMYTGGSYADSYKRDAHSRMVSHFHCRRFRCGIFCL